MAASAELVKQFPDVDPFLLFKWERVYHRFFDINASGEIDWGDSHSILRKVRSIYGSDSKQMELAKEKLKLLWEELLSVADDNKDNKISETEWCQVLKDHDPRNNVPWYLDYATFMFKLFDVSGIPFRSASVLCSVCGVGGSKRKRRRLQRTVKWIWRSIRTGWRRTDMRNLRPAMLSKPLHWFHSLPYFFTSPSSYKRYYWTGNRVYSVKMQHIK